MAAISSTLMSLLSHGDHLLAHRTLYGGTHDFITKDLPRMGVEHTFVDADDPASWAAAVRPTTRAFYVETMTNPLLEVVDLRGVASFCRERRLTSVIDNTCATPVNFRPVEHGFDLVVHSATKYLNGHSDIVAGAVVGDAERVRAAKHKLDHLGGYAGSPRVLPSSPRHQDARAARPPPERERAPHRTAPRAARRREARSLPGPGEPPEPRPRAGVVPGLRGAC